MKTIAFTRAVSAAIDRCELTHLERAPIDLARARAQHRDFEAALSQLGCDVVRLPDADDLPDAVFVQDTAIVFDELAVIARPGAASRRPETRSVARALAWHRPLKYIEAPATLDGGDVIILGRRVYVGQTPRTNQAGATQLARILEPLGYSVERVIVTDCLHLQTAVTPLFGSTILANPRWVEASIFGSLQVIEVDGNEPFAANALCVGAGVIYSDTFPRTRAKIESRGHRLVDMAVSELAKAEAGVTCCCILVPPVAAALPT